MHGQVVAQKNFWGQRPGFESHRYYISICKPLSPASILHSCPGSATSVCQATENSLAAVSLASFQQSDLTVNAQDGSVILDYADGSAGNAKQNYRSEYNCI